MEHITMSNKEREQLIVFAQLKKGEIKQYEAASQLKMSVRWIRKKYRRYEQKGDKGIIHLSRGATSTKQWAGEKRVLAVNLLKEEWQGFGPTFASEKLEELHGIMVSKETLRKVMIFEGIWSAKARKLKHRKRRERRDMKGKMVQVDGSYHDWLEGRGAWCTLLVFIDDATSELLWLEFAPRESYQGVMKATKNYIAVHGRPHEFYVDFGSVFSINLNNPERDKKTHWEIALEKLDVAIIHAHSPQAKGRVERSNQTLQDRLLHEMRLAGVSSINAANKFLHDSAFIEKHNKRFGVKATQQGDAHRPVSSYNLDDIFVLRDTRILANDYTIVYQKRIFQLQPQQKTIIRPKDQIIVNTRLDGSIHLSIRKTFLNFVEINERQKPKPKEPKMIHPIPQKPSINSRRWVLGLPPISTSLSQDRRVE